MERRRGRRELPHAGRGAAAADLARGGGRGRPPRRRAGGAAEGGPGAGGVAGGGVVEAGGWTRGRAGGRVRGGMGAGSESFFKFAGRGRPFRTGARSCPRAAARSDPPPRAAAGHDTPRYPVPASPRPGSAGRGGVAGPLGPLRHRMGVELVAAAAVSSVLCAMIVMAVTASRHGGRVTASTAAVTGARLRAAGSDSRVPASLASGPAAQRRLAEDLPAAGLHRCHGLLMVLI